MKFFIEKLQNPAATAARALSASSLLVKYTVFDIVKSKVRHYHRGVVISARARRAHRSAVDHHTIFKIVW